MYAGYTYKDAYVVILWMAIDFINGTHTQTNIMYWQ